MRIFLSAPRGAISLASGYGALKSFDYLLGNQTSESSNFFLFYDHIQRISNYFLRGILKTFAIFYVIIFVPIVEEWFFRDVIYQLQEESQPSKIYRVISNGILFGIFHISVFYGMANIAIVAVAAITGIVFATCGKCRETVMLLRKILH